MLDDLQSADRAPAVQMLVVPVLFAEKEALFVGEVALHQQLAGEIVIARQLRNFALDAALTLLRAVAIATCHGSFLSRQLSNVLAPMRVVLPIRIAGGPFSSGDWLKVVS